MRTEPPAVDVCPHCKRALVVAHAVACDGHSFPTTFRCAEHGAVPPMRSAVVNYGSEWPDWSAA